MPAHSCVRGQLPRQDETSIQNREYCCLQGLAPLGGCEGETSTKGLDSLEADCKAYRQQGARFCKWRAALRIGDSGPSQKAIDINAQQLAQYAAIAQVH